VIDYLVKNGAYYIGELGYKNNFEIIKTNEENPKTLYRDAVTKK